MWIPSLKGRYKMISSQTMSGFRNVSSISMPQTIISNNDLNSFIKQQVSYAREIFFKNLLNTEMLTAPAEDTSSEENINPQLLGGILKLSDVYTFRNFVEVTTFLKNNTSLIYILLNAFEKIKEYFPAAELFLEIVEDKESIDDQELIVFIHTELSPDDAFTQLEKLDEEWWLDASLECNGKLNITLEFE